ncbi:MAG: hypothetical protein BGO26_05475 [Actinobacteria bacterium 69-20]|nr:ABC transporter substrate-binding protein [Actinomycetota bacterium]OJV27947.1 MAG: hypothetical protein BGO26_05475 [Actinobacteria bacterium 69-20]
MARHRGRLGIGIAAVAAVALVAGCGSGNSSAGSSGQQTSGTQTSSAETPQKLEPFTVLLDWFPNPDHISLYTAQHEGYYKDAGLDVTLQSPSNSTDALKMVSLGQVDLAISYEPQIINANALGLDLVAVGALIPNPLTSIILSGKQGFSTLKDLEGRKLGSTGDPVTNGVFNAMLTKAGVDVKKVSVISLDQGLVPAIVAGQVAGVSGVYANIEGVQLRDEGIKPVIFSAKDAGVGQSDELIMIAQKSKLASDAGYKDRVKKFLDALAKGDAKSQENPELAVTSITPVAKGYDAAQLVEMVDATIPFLKNPDGGFGVISKDRWQQFADWMLGEKLLEKKVDVSNVLDMSLLPGK